MKRIYTIIVFIILTGLNSNAQIFKDLKKAVEKKITKTSTSNALSEEEIALGLKEALNIGVKKGVDQLSKPDGFFKYPEIKIPLPKEAKEVENTLRKLGQGKKVDEAIESINRAAEKAVIYAKDIFIEAIKKMTLKDALGILNGEKDAATKYLEKSTRAALVEKFKPSVKLSLDKYGATKHWNIVFSTYNKIPFVTKVNPNLDDYATNKAIDGLFYQIAKEELEIRKNPTARVTDLLKKVFGS
ncbi:MAG: DUF4197 domain-containing protein [Marinifilaceae bacterium]|jgi:hypothetical protein|nr:DUF4197 domain-containing protein [Marinifilaceae bacterium]